MQRTVLQRHRGPLLRLLAVAGIGLPLAAALLALTTYRGDWPQQRFLLLYMAPLFAFGAAWAGAVLSTIDRVEPRVLLVDGLAFFAGAIRAWGGWGVLPYSGHMLFLTFVALTAGDRRFRWTALVLLAVTSWFKLALWHDWRSWSLGVTLGVMFAVARGLISSRTNRRETAGAHPGRPRQ